MSGSCDYLCDAGYADCDAAPDCETDTRSDPNNCGGCGVTCGGVCSAGMCVTSATFSYTGAQQTFVVPPGVTSILATAYGAQGGCSLGGRGGEAIARFPVTPGETLYVYVGGAGQCGTPGMLPGGFNGGGAKYTTSGDFWEGGSGGGASDVRRGGTALTNRVVVAGGGGGRGYGGQAGAGGGLNGADGNPTGGGCDSFCAGHGGTQSAGGAGGDCNSGFCVGLPGALGVGGRGTGCAASGGGGGGGYYGGGGGGHCSAGGGSSRVDFPGNSAFSTTAGVRTGHGEITLSY